MIGEGEAETWGDLEMANLGGQQVRGGLCQAEGMLYVEAQRQEETKYMEGVEEGPMAAVCSECAEGDWDLKGLVCTGLCKPGKTSE